MSQENVEAFKRGAEAGSRGDWAATRRLHTNDQEERHEQSVLLELGHARGTVTPLSGDAFTILPADA